VPADAVTHTLQVVPCIHVVAKTRQVEPLRAELLLEASGAARSVERFEVAGVAESERVGRAVGGSDQRGCRRRQLVELGGSDARNIAVHDRDRTAQIRQRRSDCGALAPGEIDDDRFSCRSLHIREHCTRKLSIAEPRLPVDVIRDHERRHASKTNRVTNAYIAEQLEALASLLDLSGASFYTSRAYRRAAETIRETKAPIAELVAAGRVEELRGIGAGIAARLRELVETGRIAELDDLEREVQPELVGLGRFLGIAPKRMVEIGRALGVSTADEFRAAAREGRLTSVSGIGPQTEQRVLEALDREGRPQPGKGLVLNRARALLEEIAAGVDGEIAGDPRRWADTSFQLAVVASADDPAPVLDAFERLPAIVSLLERSERRAVGVTVEGVPVELIVAAPARFGTELLTATGTTAYLEELGSLPDAADEPSVYATLDIPWCPPELREQPFRGVPPRLLERGDIRGDLHMHSTWSDGKATVLEMATAAIELGYEYIAICDHTPNVRVVPGLDADDLRRQGEEIAAVNGELAPFRVLRGTEVDIRADGSLDLPDDVLAELDWVQLSLHAGQRQKRVELTKKVTEAMRHPAVRALSHPKGRIINHRPPNELDLERTFEVALETGVVVETNGLPDRLDLSGPEIKLAIEAGVPIVVSTDAHSVRGLNNMELAVHTARRGWAKAADVVNTRPLEEVLKR
jgi:DNA polymerase (family 10)